MLTPVPYFTNKEHDSWMDNLDSLDNILVSRFKKNPADSTALDKIHLNWEKENPEPIVTIADLANHFDYIKKLIGVEFIGIAGDYDGIHYFVKGMKAISSYPMLLIELARRGWTEKELKLITSENFLRVFSEIENKAIQLQQETNPSLQTSSK